MQGSTNAVINTISYSIFSNEYDGQDFSHVNTVYKGTIGIGLLIGLALGTLLYMLGGYFLPFIVYSVFMVCITPFVVKLIPSKTVKAKNPESNNEYRDIESAELEASFERSVICENSLDYNTIKSEEGSTGGYDVTTPFKTVCRLLSNKIIFK